MLWSPDVIASAHLRGERVKGWKEAGLDCMLNPGLGLPAMPHGAANKVLLAVGEFGVLVFVTLFCLLSVLSVADADHTSSRQ